MKNYCKLLAFSLILLPYIGCSTLSDQNTAEDRAYSLLKFKSRERSLNMEVFSLDNASSIFRKKIMEEQGLYIPANTLLENNPYNRGETSGSNDVFSEALTLDAVLEIAANNSREYQTEKEKVFRAALQLDLVMYDFGIQLDSLAIDSTLIENRGSENTRRGFENSASIGIQKRFLSGASFRSSLVFDLVQLLKSKSASSLGLVSDTSVNIPLLRGSGKEIVGEPLTAAERSVEYALADFDFYRRNFVVNIAREFYNVLQTRDQIQNAKDNYNNLRKSTQRVSAIAESGRIPENQVDQSRQDEYRAELRLIDAKSRYEDNLDRLKISMGIPVDAKLELEQMELERLAKTFSVPEDPLWEKGQNELFKLAFKSREDVQTFYRRVEDAYRKVNIAKDAMRAEFTIGGKVNAGSGRSLSSADSQDSMPNFNQGLFQGLLHIDLPIDRRKESKVLRESIINLQQSIREYERKSDDLKSSIRGIVREIERVLANYEIQKNSLELAKRRVERANLLLEAGRIEVRDLLEAQEAYVSSQNSLTQAVVDYRINLWSLERFLGILDINEFL
jgi:outer membrane protein TolC